MALALAICAGLGLSLAGFAVVRTWEQQQTRIEFDHQADAWTSLIELEFKTHLQELDALGRFYDGSKFVDRAEFREFVGPVLAQHSGIHAFEWLPRVTAERRAAHEQTAREDGIEGYRISERQARGQTVRAADRPEYFPIAYAEPPEDTRLALGFDCGSVPARRAALERARDSGQATATERVALAETVPERFGVLVLLPVYRGPTGTVRERRASLMGFAAT
ncbi:MAG: CHASE domain-containing protein, partial [Phycisphaerae bacterium]|nr:CHASE domain-containing protein [Phycisphaerae bacterium]